jgi:hypothetical protein
VNSTNSAPVETNQPAVGDAGAASVQASGELGAFLGTLAALLRETIARFEQTTGRVSDMVVAHTGRAGPDLVVALQDFDRLQQEFSALGEVLSRMEATTGGPWPGNLAVADLKHELLKTVTIADLKQRLALHFEAPETEPETTAPSEDHLVAEF